MTEDLEGGCLYSAWGWVLISVSAVPEAEEDAQLPLYFEVGISGPWSGERLSNQPQGVLNCAVLYLTSTWSDSPCYVLPLNSIEDGYQVPVHDE